MCSSPIRQKRDGGNGHKQEMTVEGGVTAGVGTKDKCKMSAKRGVVAGVEPAME